MDRYREIKERLLTLAKQNNGVYAVIAIGSSVRNFSKADKFSDIDLIIATDTPDQWLYGDYPENLGNIKISFVEQTLGGGLERRMLYEGSLDVDLIVLTPEQLKNAVTNGVATEVMNRGYAILYDDMSITKIIEENVEVHVNQKIISENEFVNLVEDFWFHTVWASKKILRGELWTAKMCIDAYLKNILLKVIENEEFAENKCDVWHNGRFLEKWAKEGTVTLLGSCFAHYEKKDMISSLFNTASLFGDIARHVAVLCNYDYPEEAETYAYELLEDYFGEL